MVLTRVASDRLHLWLEYTYKLTSMEYVYVSII